MVGGGLQQSPKASSSARNNSEKIQFAEMQKRLSELLKVEPESILLRTLNNANSEACANFGAVVVRYKDIRATEVRCFKKIKVIGSEPGSEWPEKKRFYKGV